MRVVFAVLLMLAISPAYAEWFEVGQSPSITFYVDPATLAKEGNRRKAWVLYDFRQRAKSGESSARMYREFDCDQKRVRTLSISYFPEPMAGGALLSKNDTPEDWQNVPAKTVNSLQLDYVCSK